MNYNDFLAKKQTSLTKSGFNVSDNELNSNLFDFQKFIVKRALAAGKYAIFADCGMGKTIMQLSWADAVCKYTGGKVLILCPLAVVGQTIQEAHKFNVEIGRVGTSCNITISNYEQLENIDCAAFDGVVLDESSILKNFTGATKQLIIDSFASTSYKLACSATPSPNDPMELGNHSEFLNVMSRNEMLAMYFVHDGGETSKWRLKGHAQNSFFKFVSSWSVMIGNPCDIGFDGSSYVLPALNLMEHQINTGDRNNGKLFNDVAVSATNFNGELRETTIDRMKKAAEIASNTNGSCIIWIKQNQEGEILRQLLPDAIEVTGSDSDSRKEKYLLGFANGDFKILITKSKIAQFGLNYQNCSTQIFASLDFSFEALYQSIRRSYRFGQKNDVNIHIITTDTMQNVLQSIKNKQQNFLTMQKQMSENVMSEFNYNKNSKITHESVVNDFYRIERGDCVNLIKNIESESIGFSVFSPPFAELYTYSDHIEDMGNSKDYKEFLTQFSFLAKELYRVIMSGRNIAIHCMDLPIQKGKEGFIGLRDFSGMIRELFENEGFIYHSRITIWKDPVIEMQRTKALGLLHKQVKKDSTMSRVGLPDYILVFRKDGDRDNPVRCDINVDTWQKYASPVWHDINYSNTLQGFRNARDEKDEKHICPLQLETIERLITLYSNKGDTVLTPFMGIGSEVYQAVKMDRIGIGFELKESYFNLAKNNCESVLQLKKQTSLF